MLSKEYLSSSLDYPVYSSDSNNNGIIGYTDNPEFICDCYHPIYITFGDHTRTFNIAQKSFSVLDNVKVLLPTINNINALMFIISVWHKQIPNLGYSRHWKVAKKCAIPLPITNRYEINFKFTEKLMMELEMERIKKLDIYLISNGLNNYVLTDNEKNALKRFDTQHTKWIKHKIGDLFERVSTKKLPYQAKELPVSPNGEFVLPCLTSSFKNQGH